MQGYFTGKVSKILETLGKKPICWNDSLKAKNLPNNLQVQFWSLQYNAEMDEFVRNGGKWIYSDMFELYLDYPYSMTPVNKILDCKPHFGKLQCDSMSGFLGYEAAIWSEHIKDNKKLEELLFPRIFALAEVAWSGAVDKKEFMLRLEKHCEGVKEAGVNITEKNWWNPKGKARRTEALNYFTTMNAGMSDEVRAETVEASSPSREFGQSFMTKFFKPLDLPFLLKSMK